MKRFILILGPSGTGKSTIIKRLLAENPRLVYVTPYTDRPPRTGENFKISITKDEFTKMEQSGKFTAVNHYFTYRYGTPTDTIETALNDGNIPILDMILSGVEKFKEYKNILYCIYIKPPSLKTLQERLLNDGRDITGQRFKEGKEELDMLEAVHFQHPDINIVIENSDLKTTLIEVQKAIENISAN
jgi:guanylate kinase